MTVLRRKPLGFALVIAVLASNAGAGSSLGHGADNVHVRANQSTARLFGPACKSKPGESAAQFQTREDLFFETSAQRLSDLDKCDVIRLRTLEKGGYQEPFIRTVVKDISVKLPSLRSLYLDIEKKKSELTELEKKNNAYDSQVARFGFLEASQIKARTELSKSITLKQTALKKPTAAYQTLYGSLWRNQDGAMAAYIKSLIRSSISPKDYAHIALEPSPSLARSAIHGNFSFLDKVVKLMIANETLFIKKIKGQYIETSKGSKFEPNFETKQILANNLDLLYDPAPTTADYKQLICDIDQKYISGVEDIDLVVTGASFLIGPFGKVIPWALRLVNLEHLIVGSATVMRAGRVLSGLPTAYWSLRAAGSAVAACESKYKRLQKETKACDAHSSLGDAEDFDARELEVSNCGLLLFATAMNKTGVGAAGFLGSKMFSGNPELVNYIAHVQQTSGSAIDVKNNLQNTIGNASTAKDVLVKVTKDPKKPDADDDSNGDDSHTL